MKDRAKNIYEKLLTVCPDPRISEDFICASDDHKLLAPVPVERLPLYLSDCLTATLNRLASDNYYKSHVLSTLEALSDRGFSTWDYNVHFPMKDNKAKFL